MKRLFSLLLVLALVVSIAGCSPAPSDGSDDAAAQSDASDDAAASTDGESAAGGEIKMAWYFPMPFPYGDTVQEGVKKFETDTGITVIQQVGPDMEQSSQNERVEALAAQNVNALSIYPSDPSGANALYEELAARGVKIVNFGTSTTEPTAASFAVATDVKQAAYDACEYLIEQMGGKGNILNVLEVISDPNTILRHEGIEECVASHPDVTIAQEISDINSSEEAVVKIESGFSANASNIDGIICTGYATTVGLTTVLENYYDQGGERVFAIGMDTDPLVIDSITDGVLNATMAQNPLGHGYISCMLLKLMVMDGYTPIEGKYFVDSGCAIVTKDNLETYEEDVEKVTQTILDSLTTEYLTK
jgi:ribose transport system substrate-binding protein